MKLLTTHSLTVLTVTTTVDKYVMHNINVVNDCLRCHQMRLCCCGELKCHTHIGRLLGWNLGHRESYLVLKRLCNVLTIYVFIVPSRYLAMLVVVKRRCISSVIFSNIVNSSKNKCLKHENNSFNGSFTLSYIISTCQTVLAAERTWRTSIKVIKIRTLTGNTGRPSLSRTQLVKTPEKGIQNWHNRTKNTVMD